MRIIIIILCSLFVNRINAQEFTLSGVVKCDNPKALISLSLNGKVTTLKNDTLNFTFRGLQAGNYHLQLNSPGYKTVHLRIQLQADTVLAPLFLLPLDEQLHEVVITGTQKEVNRLESPVPVEVYTAKFFLKNPTPGIFEALQTINGVRPQLNCNICNTGDIHINGLEGPYTMVMIDGMPIVSSLSTVYGLSGIPNSMVEQIEVVKGPASSLYGSEAVGGLINIITKNAERAPAFSGDVMTTGYGEHLADIGLKLRVNPKIAVLTGFNYFKLGNKMDHNGDGFTDVTLQDRISVFQKWHIQRKENRLFSIAGRLLYEDRWGGELNWNKHYRGGDERYGESIYTFRTELIGNYQLPVSEKIALAFSLTDHQQDSRYGNTSYIARQHIAFSQLTWDKKWGKQDILMGAALRYTYYDDNTPATVTAAGNNPEHIRLPGIFVQDEVKLSAAHTLLAGLRYDHHNVHGHILTPRLAYKFRISEQQFLRLNAGTGFRVVNLFTEDHAALTGARTVIIADKLKPERTYNINLNYLLRRNIGSSAFLGLDASVFYTHFNNRIIGDFDSHPDQIIYQNLKGYAMSRGLTFNMELSFSSGFKGIAGITLQDVSYVTGSVKRQQLLTERFSGTWTLSYKFNLLNLNLDYTGNLYGPMQLPLAGKLDPRSQLSPWWSIQNIQLSYELGRRFSIYGGVKNLLNFTPDRHTSFLIARADDPFDKKVEYDASGQIKPSGNNPYALTFDPNYIYAPNQGRRGFIGIRMTIQRSGSDD